MPTIPTYTLAWSPTRAAYEVSARGKQKCEPISLDSPGWFAWLERVQCFAFVGQNGRYTARQEISARGERNWYAYVAHDGRRHKALLGKREAVTKAHLESVAARLWVSPEEQHAPQDLLWPTTSQETSSAPHSAAMPSSPVSPAHAGHYLLATKLHVPRLRTRLISRAHLIEQVQRGVAGPLTLVSAPAGFGKTTLLAQWLAQSNIPVAWLSLESEDNDPTRFLTYLIAALQALGLQIGTSALVALQTPQPPSPDAILTQLINELMEQGEGEFALVLDDYHVITTEAIQRGMVSFVEHLPPRLHLLLATRGDPPFPLARLRARGQLTEVRTTDLRFNAAETSDFLHHVMGLELEASEVATLEQRTEGWLAGLQLAALSLRGKADPAAFLATFSGTHRFVLEYLTDEVLARQPAPIQQFLLHTCVLERLSGPLCDAVLEREGSQVLLETLDKANLFVVALDEVRHWYRYHHLFAEALRRHLQQRESALVPHLHRRASSWYEQHEQPVEAVQHAFAIPDAALAARLIESIALPMIFQGKISTVYGWITALPEAVVRTHPCLSLYYAMVLMFTNQLEEAKAHLQDAEQSFQELPPEQAQTVLGGVFTCRASIARYAGNILQGETLAHQALDLLPKAEVIFRMGALATTTRAFLVSGNVTSTTESEVVDLLRTSPHLFATVANTCLQVHLYVLQGRLRLAAATLERVVQLVPHVGALRVMYSSVFYYFSLGDLLRERNELEAAERHLAQGMALINEALTVEPFAAVLGYTALARLHQARGDTRAALTSLDALARLAKQRHYPAIWVAQGKAVQAQLALAQGDLAAAIRWADASGLSTEDDLLPYSCEGAYLVLARVRLAQGCTDRLLSEVLLLLDRLQTYAQACGRLGSVLEIRIVRALAQAAGGDRTAALITLEQALVQAAPESYIRLFIDEGELMLALLRHAQAHSAVPQYIATLLSAFGEPPSMNRISLTPGVDDLLEPLTRREREVLHLLLEGASNREIAQRLVLSVSTVKRHVYNLCGKLEVRSRTQAIIRARDLHC